MATEDDLDAFAAWERTSWEDRAEPYAASLTDLTRGSAPALLDAAGVGPGTRVLDVGTGPGLVAQAAAARQAVVVAADQSAAMVRIARAAGGLDVVHAPVEDLSFVDGAFDAVVAGYLLNHLARPATALAELARVLRPGGRLALTVWDVPDRNPALGVFTAAAQRAGAPAPEVPPGPESTRYSDPAVLRALLEQVLDDVVVEHPGWQVEVEPGEWFDAVAAATPRTGAVLASLGPVDRARVRAAYDEVVAPYRQPGGRLVLPAGAVVGAGRRR